MYREGGIIGKQNTPTGGAAGVASGVWKMNEHHVASVGEIWPVHLEFSVAASLNTITNVPINVRFTTTAGDNTDPFDTVDVTFTSGGSAAHQFYIACVPRGSASYYNDLCIGAFQIIKDSDDSIALSKGGNDTSSMETTTVASGTAISDTDPTNESYSSVAIGSTARRWNIASSTSSSRTGAAGGVNDVYSASTLLPSPGLGVVSQIGAENYFYPETSASSLDRYYWMRSPSVDLSTGTAYTLRICYHFMTSTGQTAASNNIMYTYIDN